MKDNVFSSDNIARRTYLRITDRTSRLLTDTVYAKNNFINSVTKNGVRQAYEHMRAGEHPREKGTRPAQIQVQIYHPITDAQSKTLNADNASKARTAGVAIGVITSRVHPIVGMAAGKGTFDWTLYKLRSWDTGDILIKVEIAVIGGIGPQRTYRSVVVKRSAYDENDIEL